MKYKYAAYCLAIKNDFCLEESITTILAQGVSKVLIVSPQAYWSNGKPQNEEDLLTLKDIAYRTGAAFESVLFKHEPGTNSALYAEAQYRNFGAGCLVQDATVDFVLTVDADEYWLPGTLEHIDSLATEGSLNIALPGIPVIGVPGLPVKGAKDAILVATSRDLKFAWGRASDASKRIMGTTPVIHFTAVRKTLNEVAEKHRLSAHYGDPSYDFDGWIENVLPSVQVGTRNVHMYKSPENIWPEVRAWTPCELAAIPEKLHPYLAKIL